jgi:hypothetical protein
MPNLRDHQSNTLVKLLLLGDSKTGKTGSLASLVAAGYKLRILDFDNLLDYFTSRVMAECPDQAENVEYFTVRDKMKAGAMGMSMAGAPKAWITAIKMLDRWAYEGTDLGVPAEWGADCILVIDSLSRLADAAYAFHESVTPSGKGGQDGRAIYGNAQRDIEKMLAMLTSSSFATNVIVICHGTYQEMPDGKTKVWPQSLGQKLGPVIPEYFPNFIKYSTASGKRTIQLDGDSMISLANGNPALLKGTLDVETGLAKFFEALREAPREKPKSLIMKRVI